MSKFHRHNSKAARLTPEQVWTLRREYAAGATQGALSRKYEVSVGQIGRIVRGEAWQGHSNPAEFAGITPAHPEPDDITASQQRLAERLTADIAQARETSHALDEFINPDAKRRYLGDSHESEQSQGQPPGPADPDESRSPLGGGRLSSPSGGTGEDVSQADAGEADPVRD